MLGGEIFNFGFGNQYASTPVSKEVYICLSEHSSILASLSIEYKVIAKVNTHCAINSAAFPLRTPPQHWKRHDDSLFLLLPSDLCLVRAFALLDGEDDGVEFVLTVVGILSNTLFLHSV